MLYITHGAATPLESIDIDRVGIVLLIHVEAHASAKNIMEEQHLISIY